MNALTGQAATRVLHHLDGSILQTVDQLSRDIQHLAHQASLATGVPVRVRTHRIVETLSLVIA